MLLDYIRYLINLMDRKYNIFLNLHFDAQKLETGVIIAENLFEIQLNLIEKVPKKEQFI